jgi:hypothetical protein
MLTLTHPRTLLLLLAACGPGHADTDDSSATSTAISASDSSTSDTPTSTPSSESSSGETPPGEPQGPRLIGLAFEQTTKLWDTVTLDLATGELIVLDTLPASIESIRAGTGAFDPATRRIFQLTYEADHIFTIDGDSGKFIGVAPLQAGDLSIVGNLEVNNAGELVGLAVDDATIHTLRFDPATGALTPLATLPPGLGTPIEGTGAFEPATNRMFAVTMEKQLLMIDAATGTLVNSSPMKPIHINLLVELEVNNAGELLGIHSPLSPGPFEVVRVDPLTAAFTVLDHLTPTTLIYGQVLHDTALDHLLVMSSNDGIRVHDASTGAELSVLTIAPGDHIGLFNPELVL